MDHSMVVDAKNSTFSAAILIFFGIQATDLKHQRSPFSFPDSYSVDNLAIENARLRYDTIRQKRLTWTKKLSIQLNLAHVARKRHYLPKPTTQGNSLKIANRRCHYNLRKYSFSMRITNVWNSLPFSVVTAPSVNSFKNRLDKHWALQELKHDWEAELEAELNFEYFESYHFIF